MSTKKNLEHIKSLMPNREAVFHYIWDTLHGPLPVELDQYLVEKISVYGSWKEKYRPDGQLAYKGWIYKKRKQGHWIYKFRNGKDRVNCFYRNNEYHGRCVFWKEDGSYEVREYYKGRLNGSVSRHGKDRENYGKSIYEMGKWKW